jgi:orotate phosphoribosyltransferase
VQTSRLSSKYLPQAFALIINRIEAALCYNNVTLTIKNMASTEIAKILLENKAVKLSFNPPFTYTSGMKGPIYTDNRVLVSFVGARDTIVDGFLAAIKENNLEFDYVAGTATAGIPWAAFVAQKLGVPMIYIRPEPKGHGTGKQIEGFLEAGKRVLVVEDLVTTGGSSLKSVNVVKNEGKCICDSVLAIFTYGLGKSVKAFGEAGVKLFALTDLDELLKAAVASSFISADDEAKILEYKADPENWAKKMGL